jgi:hypothetical protein
MVISLDWRCGWVTHSENIQVTWLHGLVCQHVIVIVVDGDDKDNAA